MAKYFKTVPSNSMSRGGGNGPLHPSQFIGLGFVESGESMLDCGFGSCTTTECLVYAYPHKEVKYKGVDFVDHRIPHALRKFPLLEFEQQDVMSLDEEDGSWDVVWGRHIVEHVRSFEDCLDEFLRVAKKRVVATLFNPLTDKPDHKISRVTYDGVEYDEYYNEYSRNKVMDYLKDKDWFMIEKIGIGNKQTDTVIVIHKEI